MKILRSLWLFALLACPFVLWLLPADFFNESSVLMCPSRSILDLECLGCGITRAVMHFHHFDFLEAYFYNALVVVVYPFLTWLWYRWVRTELLWLGYWPQRLSRA